MPNKITMSELQDIIKNEVKRISESYDDLPFDEFEFDDEARKAAMQDIGDDFEDLGTNRFEKGMNPKEFIGTINQAQMGLDSDEEEFARISKMISKRKSHEDRFGKGSLNEWEDNFDEGPQSVDDELSELEGGENPSLFHIKDSKGNPIKKGILVINIDGVRKGRVSGFGDDGQGSPIVIVDYQWPMDMKFTNPDEMGTKREVPTNLIVVENLKENDMDNFEEEQEEYHFDTKSLYHWLADAMYALQNHEPAEAASIMEKTLLRDFMVTPKSTGGMTNKLNIGDEQIEEMRGLGHSVKNTGDRNVKLNDDHSQSPLVNLNESVNNKIKTLFETKITKKDLLQFIKNEAKDIAKNIK